MEKVNTYMINKIFTVPYIDRMISEDCIPDSFLKCVKRYVKSENSTLGNAISEIYHYMESEYRNEYFYKNTILNQLLIKSMIYIIRQHLQNFQLESLKRILLW